MENIELVVGDKFILHSENGRDYIIEIVNVNEYREPSLRYAADVWDDEGNHPEDVMFFGDEFFEKNRSKIEKIDKVYHTEVERSEKRMNDRVSIDENIIAQDRMLQFRKEKYDFKEELRQQKLRIDQLEQELNHVNKTISKLIRLL